MTVQRTREKSVAIHLKLGTWDTRGQEILESRPLNTLSKQTAQRTFAKFGQTLRLEIWDTAGREILKSQLATTFTISKDCRADFGEFLKSHCTTTSAIWNATYAWEILSDAETRDLGHGGARKVCGVGSFVLSRRACCSVRYAVSGLVFGFRV